MLLFKIALLILTEIYAQDIATPAPEKPKEPGESGITAKPAEPEPRPDPNNPEYPLNGTKDQFFDWLIEDAESNAHVEYEGYDGWYNNPTHPELGSVDSQLVRIFPPAYEDGVYEPSGKNRPNPLNLSRSFLFGQSGEKSNTGKTALLVFFGQQVVEELLDVQRPGCPPEYFNIPIPEDHEYRTSPEHTEMPVLRSRYDVRTGQSPNNPRQQINEITPWIDGGLTYGIAKGWSDGLRAFNAGLLASSHNEKFPAYNDILLPMANPPPPRQHRLEPVKRFFRLGNPRGNENPFLLTFGILWFRWHNEIAKALKRKYPNWTDEKLYNEARRWVIATHQHMIIDEWLPEWLGEPLNPYSGYDSSVDPGIAHEFQTTAMRFGHTLVTSGAYRRAGMNEGCKIFNTTRMTHFAGHRAVRTCNSFWNPQEAVLEHDIDGLLLGLASQPSEREDNIIVEDLRGRVFGPLEFSRRDLMAINIQRARDHGLPDYRTARRLLNLSPVNSFSDMAIICNNVNQLNSSIFTNIMPAIYGKNPDGSDNVDNIDMWIGGILETERTRPGELFRTIILDQMRRIRDGDRFWFENQRNDLPNLFTKEQIRRIKQVNIYSMIWSLTEIQHGDLQRNPFRLPAESNKGLNDTCRTNMGMKEYSCYNTRTGNNETCYYLEPLGPTLVAECTSSKTFDYFDGSRESFALTWVASGLFVIGCVQLLILLARHRRKATERIVRKKSEKRKHSVGKDAIIAEEWLGKKEGTRQIAIKINPSKMITIHGRQSANKLRFVDLSRVETIELQVSAGGYKPEYFVLIRVAREYDLVLKYSNSPERDTFIRRLEEYLGEIGVGRQRREINVNKMLNDAITKSDRQKQLEKFFRVVCSQAFDIDHNEEEVLQLDALEARAVINTEITLYEFAEALSLRADADFVQKMFALADKGNKGFISFREFLDIMVVFAKGTAENKMKLMFDMYDIDHSQKLSIEEFTEMIKSMLELANQSLTSEQLNTLLTSMFKKAGLNSKQDLQFEDFLRLMSDYKDELGYAQLSIGILDEAKIKVQPRIRQSAIAAAQTQMAVAYRKSVMGDVSNPGVEQEIARLIQVEEKKPATASAKMTELKRYVDNYKLHIFWLVLYTLLLFGIFIERAYYYSLEREHGGLRRIAGFGISVTRGAASVMMFTYSTILLTVCRNLITICRGTFLKHLIPFNSFIEFHKYISFWGLVFSAIHTIGHAFNFYHIATQTADDLTCLFRDYYHATDVLPKFHYWCFQTVTGLTGVLLVLLLAVMYIFASAYSRQNVFNAFWRTHCLYPAFYILMTLHGLGRIVQDPWFYYFLLGPLCAFILDKLISASRKKIEISLVKAIVHPSNVIELQLKRPARFEYCSGQWIRIACPLLNGDEYHPFTISSAPHEDILSLHIRAVGPWTFNIKQLLDPNNIQLHAYPKIYLDGPFGEGHQEWCNYEISVLVGSGIGVTPFASILKDLISKASSSTNRLQCKKIIFLWITRTQKQFEWMTDIIRKVEGSACGQLVECHIFITQFYAKYDLRTTMLYICERHFQRISNKSLFTGLSSMTHFGRPDFHSFFQSLRVEYGEQVREIGVFSCGGPSVTRSVQNVCDEMNKREGTFFVHISGTF